MKNSKTVVACGIVGFFVVGSLVLTMLAGAVFGAVPNTATRTELPLGYQVLSNPSNATLTVPAGSLHVKLSVRGGGVMETQNGTAPTSTTGFYLPAGALLVSDNDPQIIAAYHFTCSTDNSGSCTVYAEFTGSR